MLISVNDRIKKVLTKSDKEKELSIEHYANIEISKAVIIKIQKASISAVVPKGTIEAA